MWSRLIGEAGTYVAHVGTPPRSFEGMWRWLNSLPLGMKLYFWMWTALVPPGLALLFVGAVPQGWCC
jgi:hypothetical protein